ncbi:phage capsid protein [Terasakiella sp. A23]|uniref:phage capsid protein n=1 Tax=Terasakiella sp. FCG-A23 TaxID=3080561 RepID=UPI002952E04E|nr:phage capsid protein [Terasakiella sp. A23]MDV7341769.1 phage capsid protein [Terasakiella sp. A23]
MSTSVENSFIGHYVAEVHLQYQQMGSKLRNTVRTKNNIEGATTTFQKIGKGTASTKGRHGKVPIMNIDHEPVECKLYDYYAGDWIDKLDEIKTNINEMQVVSKAGAYALGRKTDELVINELDKSTNFAGAGTDGLTKAKVLEAFEMMGEADVPDDGDRYAIVGWKQWSDLLQIDEFTKADYVGEDDLPWKGTQAKKWLGTLWMPHSGLTKTSDVRYCYWYHKTAIGHAIGHDIKSDVSWHGDRAAHFVNNMMSQGSTLIDPTGVVSLRCLEAA